MAGVHFSFNNIEQLIRLHIGISDRMDENRSESFTVLYCDFSSFSDDVIKSSLEQVLRNSDTIANCGSDYFFVLPYTDKYGAGIVKKIFEDFFAQEIKTHMVAYPGDGESAKELLTELQNGVSRLHANDLRCLDEVVFPLSAKK
ncbi:MAG: hypothetical protein AB7U24_03090 [Sulfurimonadaceae bacterium]|jgi:hypothetical protein